MESQAFDTERSDCLQVQLCPCEAYSRRDIERLHAERSHLRQLFKDLKVRCLRLSWHACRVWLCFAVGLLSFGQAEGERADEEVWELGMQEPLP